MNGRAVSGRHYGMDWLRIGAFGLLILYHIGMFFVPWDWHVKARATPDWVTLPMHFTNAWRLQLLFLVSHRGTLTGKRAIGTFPAGTVCERISGRESKVAV